MNYQGTTALITGASVGLGEEFARQLRSQGANLVLVARSVNKLTKLAATIKRQSEVQVTVIPADLSSEEEVSRLIGEVKSRGFKIDFLINNAGFGIFESFLDTPL